MLDVAMGLYVDHQEALRYPIAYVSSYWWKFRKIYWFVSDYENARAASMELANDKSGHLRRVKIVLMNLGINKPSDIAPVYDTMIRHLRDSGCRYIARQEADLVFTDKGLAVVEQKLAWGNDAAPFTVPAMCNKLRYETWDNPVGAVFLKADGYYHCGDQSDWNISLNPNGDRHELPQGHPGRRLMLDLGYLTVDAIRRKCLNHAKLWPEPEMLAYKAAFEISNEEGLKLYWNRIKRESKSGSMAWDDQYAKIYHDLGLVP